MVSGIGVINHNPFGNSKVQEKKQIDPQILSFLEKLGVDTSKLTGDPVKDSAIIQPAMQKAEQSGLIGASDNDKINKGHHGKPPEEMQQLFSFMGEIGLSPTGSIESDMTAISAKLSTMSSQATTDQEKANVASLQANYQTILSQINSVPFSAEQNQASLLNKHFMLSK
ncbi:MAG: hypothetical protein WCK67_09705 [bacterium]